MKTIPEIIHRKLSNLHSKCGWFLIWYRDKLCFLFGHRYRYLSDIFGNFQGADVCKRCNCFEEKHEDEEFYHNWEMNYGKYARCHHHS